MMMMIMMIMKMIIIIIINSNDRIAETLFPRDMVCFRNICINILHKGDNEDDDNICINMYKYRA